MREKGEGRREMWKGERKIGREKRKGGRERWREMGRCETRMKSERDGVEENQEGRKEG